MPLNFAIYSLVFFIVLSCVYLRCDVLVKEVTTCVTHIFAEKTYKYILTGGLKIQCFSLHEDPRKCHLRPQWS